VGVRLVKNYIVKSGSIDDLKGIVVLDRMVFVLSRTPEEIEDKLKLQKDVHITVAAISDGRLVGYGIGHEYKGKYYLWSLAVLPEYRRKGIGSEIIDEQNNFAGEKGYASFLVKTSNRWKEMLRLLLKKEFNIIGFKEHEWEDGPLGSAIWLEKNIL
jgi:ribosomal protein S18 acetylase RimI-like enzyme